MRGHGEKGEDGRVRFKEISPFSNECMMCACLYVNVCSDVLAPCRSSSCRYCSLSLHLSLSLSLPFSVFLFLVLALTRARSFSRARARSLSLALALALSLPRAFSFSLSLALSCARSLSPVCALSLSPFVAQVPLTPPAASCPAACLVLSHRAHRRLHYLNFLSAFSTPTKNWP